MASFGWSYPPGAANDPNAPYNQTESPCGVCGRDVDHCICPECPVCETQGDPACYDGAVKCSWCGIRSPLAPDCMLCASDNPHQIECTKENVPTHGMIRSQAQIDSLLTAQEAWRQQAENDSFDNRIAAFRYNLGMETQMADDKKLDAYGHLNWTVGNEDWIACFDARRVGDQIEYHVVVDCESAGFTETPEKGTVPATAEGIAQLEGLAGKYADACSEMYADSPDPDDYGPVEWQDTDKSWKQHLQSLLEV